MRFLGTVSAALALTSVLGFSAAYANENTQPKNSKSLVGTVQDQYFKAAQVAPATDSYTPARVVVADDKTVTVLVAEGQETLSALMARHNLQVDDFRSADSRVLDGNKVLADASILFLFRVEQKAKFEKIDLPAPTEEMESSSVPAGERVVLTEGTPGVALLTSVTTNDFSLSRKLNSKASIAKEAPVVQSFTILEAPKAEVILIGTGTGTAMPELAGEEFRYPVLNPYITSHYGMRVHPITGKYKLHDGTDFGVDCGAPVFAVKDGTVSAAYFNGAYGNQISLEHSSSLLTSYSHLSAFNVEVGDTVKAGDLIGYAGTTGLSTGCHLHFMVRVNGIPTSPEDYFIK